MQIQLIPELFIPKAKKTRGEWAIRPRDLHNRLRQIADEVERKIKNHPCGIIK